MNDQQPHLFFLPTGAREPEQAPEEQPDDSDEFASIQGTIRSVRCLEGEESGSAEWGAYKIIIKTDRGTWHINGCHDMGPGCRRVASHP